LEDEPVNLFGGICGWEESIATSNDDFNWVATDRKDADPGLSPSSDHTTSGSSGHYFYINKGIVSYAQQAARLDSPMFSYAHPTCQLHFWMYQTGSSPGTLEVVMFEEGVSSLMAEIQGDFGSTWREIVLEIGHRPNGFQVTFNKEDSGYYSGRTAIDDVSFVGCQLPTGPDTGCEPGLSVACGNSGACVNVGYGVCDGVDDCGDQTDEQACDAAKITSFEDREITLWTQETGMDDFDWTVWQGKAPVQLPGPYRDHTLQTSSGHYLYVDYRQPRKSEDTAYYNSPVVQASPSAQGCMLRLWYFMEGADLVPLQIFTKTASNGGWQLKRSIDKPETSSTWNQAVVPLVETQNFAVVIIATVGRGESGIVAIDDISFSQSCAYSSAVLPTLSPSEPPPSVAIPTTCDSQKELNCAPNGGIYCIPNSRKCDFREDCAGGLDEQNCVGVTCNFENGICNWLPMAGSQASWTVGQGPSGDGSTPSSDNTSGSGKYLYAKGTNTGANAVVSSGTISRTGPECYMEFSYWMGDSQSDVASSLSVNIGSSEDYSQQTAWVRSGLEQTGWIRARALIGQRKNFEVLIQALGLTSATTSIAIDDVTFVNCEPPMPQATCQSNEIQCANDVCVPADQVCDFANDCGDNTDELETICYLKKPRCDFELDTCNYQVEPQEYLWQLVNGANGENGGAPTSDHTLGLPEGHFMYANINSLSGADSGKARFATPGLFLSTSANCYVRFYVHQPSSDDVLNVYARTWIGTTQKDFQLIMDTSSGPYGDFWQRREIKVPKMNENFQIVFESDHRGGTKSISLDDVSFTDGCTYDAEGSHGNSPTKPPPSAECGEGLYSCGEGSTGCYGDEQRCDFLDYCKNFLGNGLPGDEATCGAQCTFEYDTCGWTNSPSAGSQADWVFTKGSTDPNVPSNDHTTGSSVGSFMYVATGSSLAPVGTKSHLISDVYKMSKDSCQMSFYYTMKSLDDSKTDMGSLKVVIKLSTAAPLTLLNVQGSQGSAWTQATVTIGSKSDFEIMFEVENGKDAGHVAIDDVIFAGCGDQSAGHNCQVGLFQCDMGICVPGHQVCDLHDDCPDSSDEVGCTFTNGDCTFDGQIFENGCRYTQNKDDNYDWIISTGVANARATPTSSGPPTDHTPDSQNGKFVYVDVKTWDVGATAVLTTGDAFKASHDLCAVRFFYYMTGSDTSTILKVFVQSADGKSRQLAATFVGYSVLYDAQWQYAYVPLATTHDFRVQFEGAAGAGNTQYGGVIAIDDVTFNKECTTGSAPTPPPLACSSDEFSCARNGVVECLTTRWKCDGVTDCDDGYDEVGCPPVSTHPQQTTPSQNTGQCRPDQFRCKDDECVAGLYVCDGVADCSNAADEAQCSNQCKAGQFYCYNGGGQCLDASLLCNGKVDCMNFMTDESLCQPACPPNYCSSHGKCSLVNNGGPACNCDDGYVGVRCEKKRDPVEQKDTDGINGGQVAGIIIGSILGLAIVVLLFWYLYDRSVYTKKSRGNFGNPLFDNSVGGTRDEQYEATEMASTSVSVRAKKDQGLPLEDGGHDNPNFENRQSSHFQNF